MTSALSVDLAAFSAGPTASDQLEALKRLTKAKALTASSARPEFDAGLALLIEQVSVESGDEAWVALACLGRVVTSIKRVRPILRSRLTSRMTERLPGGPALDREDRIYVATTVRIARPPWAPAYFADVVVSEESAEKLRRTAIAGLLESSGTVDSAFAALRSAFSTWTIDTADPASTTASRLRRVLRALQTEWAQSAKDPGEHAGRELALLIDDLTKRSGLPPDDDSRAELARLVAGIVHELIRARFSRATEASTYEPLEVLQSWFDRTTFRSMASSDSNFDRLATDLEEALRVLVRAGLTDNRLMRVWNALAKDDIAAATRRESVAASMPEAPPIARAWLAGTSPPTDSHSANFEESMLRSFDRVLAALLLSTEASDRLAGLARVEVAPRLGTSDPQAESLLLDLLDRIADSTVQLRDLFDQRSLRPFLSAGDVLDFHPVLHESVGGSPTGVRRVRVIEPGVEAVDGKSSGRVVRKALVEPVTE